MLRTAIVIIVLTLANSSAGQVNFDRIESAWKTLQKQKPSRSQKTRLFIELIERELKTELPLTWRERLNKLAFDTEGIAWLPPPTGGRFAEKKSDDFYVLPNGYSLRNKMGNWVFSNNEVEIPFNETKSEYVRFSVEELEAAIPFVACNGDGNGGVVLAFWENAPANYHMYRLSKDGTIMWDSKVSDQLSGSPSEPGSFETIEFCELLITREGAILVGSTNNLTYIEYVELNSGKRRWTFGFEAKVKHKDIKELLREIDDEDKD